MNTTIAPKKSKFQITLLVLLILNLLLTGFFIHQHISVSTLLFKSNDLHYKANDLDRESLDLIRREIAIIQENLKDLDTEVKYQALTKK